MKNFINTHFLSTEMMDSSTFKRFSTSVDNILENLEDVDLTSLGTCKKCDKRCFCTMTSEIAVQTDSLINPMFALLQMMTKSLRSYCSENNSSRN